MFLAIRRLALGVFGKQIRQLILVDNMAVCLSVNRSRAKDYRLLRIIRKIQSYCLARDILFTLRWIPSESNTADKPSRIFELVNTCNNAGPQREPASQRCTPADGRTLDGMSDALPRGRSFSASCFGGVNNLASNDCLRDRPPNSRTPKLESSCSHGSKHFDD